MSWLFFVSSSTPPHSWRCDCHGGDGCIRLVCVQKAVQTLCNRQLPLPKSESVDRLVAVTQMMIWMKMYRWLSLPWSKTGLFCSQHLIFILSSLFSWSSVVLKLVGFRMSLRNLCGTYASFLCSHSFIEAPGKSAGLSAGKWKLLFYYYCCGPQSAHWKILSGIHLHISVTLSRVWGSRQCDWQPHLLLYYTAASILVQSSIFSHPVKWIQPCGSVLEPTCFYVWKHWHVV